MTFFGDKINGKMVANIFGEVLEIKQNKSGSKTVIISVKMVTKDNLKSNQNHKKTATNITEKYKIKNFQNINNYQNIDRGFVEYSKGYAHVKWIKKDKIIIMENPPGKVQVSFKNRKFDGKIGDEISVKVFIEDSKKNDLLNGFNFENYFNSKIINNRGFAISNPVITKRSEGNRLNNFFQKLRQKIIIKIKKSEVSNRSSSFILAMLVSDRSQISEIDYEVIKVSGLAHLISISGLHMSLAAGIFFVIFRFFLVRSQYLALNYDIRKISAFLAILSSFFYLKIANSPISAIRAFIAICFLMSAILLNRKTCPLRVIFFAALIIALINPYSVLQISYQLSFAAILAIACCNDLLDRGVYQYELFNKSNKNKLNIYLRSLIGILSFSLAAQIATTPFLIYHFNNYPIYGLLANIIALPIASLITMPLGFLSLFLMIFNLENISLVPMSKSLDVIFETGRFVYNIRSSKIEDVFLPPNILILIIIFFLIFVISGNGRVKIISLISYLTLVLFPYQKNLPDVMIDYSSSNVIFNRANNVMFIKKPRKSKRLKKIITFFDKKEIAVFNKCKKSYCEINFEDIYKKDSDLKNILIITNRLPLDKVCNMNYDLVINVNKRYQAPLCFKQKKVEVIDNWDLLRRGNHFIYLSKGRHLIRTIK